MKMAIKLPRTLATHLLHLAQISPDKEICGLISSKDGLPVKCYPIDNVADEPAHQFLLDAQQQIMAMKQMREEQETLFAVYHSHPTAPAEPSSMDIEKMPYSNVYSFIISLNLKGVLELRAFEITHQKIKEIHLTL